MNNPADIIGLALAEDLPQGDITTQALHSSQVGKARLVAKSPLVLSGKEVFEEVYRRVDDRVNVKWKFKNGQKVKSKSVVCEIEGPLSSILMGERVALNFLGHLSGVATLTSLFVKQIKNTKTKITDTRKTTPGMRIYEKQAVLHGGGVNHRMSLSDAFLIKENHIRTAGGITKAVQNCRAAFPQKSIEVEVTDLKELQEALQNRVERVMLDNMSLALMQKAVKLAKGKTVLEASGNMNLQTVLKVAKTGVDLISVGKITHSAPVADLSMQFEEK